MELLDIYDSTGIPTGKTIVRGDKNTILGDNEHIAVGVIYIENSKGEFLIQKTSIEKGGEFSSTGGHITHNETPLSSIKREVEEELGINVDNEDIKELGFMLYDKPLRYMFYLKKDINLDDVKLQQEEVDYVKYMTIEEINNLIETNQITKSHGILFKEVLNKIGVIMKNKLFINELPIETERLIIKPTTKEDIELILKLDKQEITQQFLGGVKNKTKEERLEFLNKKEQKFNQGISSSLTVYLKESNIPIGFIGAKIDEEQNSSEISYIFDIDHTKKGYCTESMKKIIEICFNKVKLSKIYADTVEKNESSKKVLLNLGFKYIGNKTENNTVFDEYELYNENN